MKLKIYSLIIVNHVLVVAAILFGPWSTHWGWIFLGLLLFGKIGGEVGYHRYFCHSSFETNRAFRFLLLYLGSLNCFGSPIAWSAIHHTHHLGSDTSRDPHGKLPVWRVWLTLWRPTIISPRLVRSLRKDPIDGWIHRNYFVLVIGTFFVFSLYSVWLAIFLISIPAVLTFHSAGLVNTVCHRWGYRNFETQDDSRNNLLVNCITLGSGLHNNHHKYPKAWNNSFQWYEIDLVAWIIRFMKIPKNE